MSVHMRKHLIDQAARIKWHGAYYAIPIKVIKKYKITRQEQHLSVEEVFADLLEKRGQPGALLRGLRARESLTQVKFAKLIGVTQANLSAMENGRRSIGKEVAKRIAKIFKEDYRIFL